MQHHRLSEHDVEQVISAPDSSEPQPNGRTRARKTLDGRRLRVVYTVENGAYVIVTALEER